MRMKGERTCAAISLIQIQRFYVNGFDDVKYDLMCSVFVE